MNFTDDMGLWIHVQPKDRADYDAAKQYLSKDPGMKQIFEDLRTSPTEFDLITNDQDDDRFIPKDHAILWDPRSALRPDSSSNCPTGQSPALGLGHEFDHADAYDKGPTASNARHNTPDPDYENAEEKRVIAGSETTAAHNLGEGTRTDHGGSTYSVKGSTDH